MSEVAYDAMDAPAESATVTRTAPAKSKPNKRRAQVSIDMRFAIGRRIKELTAAFRERVGPDADQDPVLLAAVEKAARLTALAEDAAARATRAIRSHARRRCEANAGWLTFQCAGCVLTATTRSRPSLSDYLAARGGQP